MIKLNLDQKGIVFGLDARIVLAILAIVSLGISITQETQVTQEQKLSTQARMRIIKTKLLKHWEDIRFRGYGLADDDSKILTTSRGYVAADGSSNREVNFVYSSTSKPDVLSDYLNEYDSQKYKLITKYISSRYINSQNYYFKIYNNMPLDFYNNWGNLDNRIYDMILHIFPMIKRYLDEDGYARIDKVEDPGLSVSFNQYALGLDEDSFGNRIRIYAIAELGFEKYDPSPYIVNFVMYSLGSNRKLDTELPKTLNDLRDFRPQGDDIFEIFSTRDVYMKAKAENLRRLKLISDKLQVLAESAYADKLSACELESTPSAGCDLNSDGSFDWKDKNILRNYNPYPKSEWDTTSANYLSATVYKMREDSNADEDSENFVKNALGLPAFYGVDLFGNAINYDSNVNKTTEGPYTMEVWY